MSNPYFEVGEEVLVCSKDDPRFNGDRTIKDHRYGRFRTMAGVVRGAIHAYKLYDTDDEWYNQSSLRKKHKPSDESFSEIMANYTTVNNPS